MLDNMALIRESILRDMSEGVMTISFEGIITSMNPAAEQILELSAQALLGQSFALCFFEHLENDAFNQTVLDAVYDTSATHENIVPYFTGTKTRQLHVTTSFLRDGGRKVGVIAVLGDISELTELRDAVKAMERIKMLNCQLELRNQLLSETFGRFLSDEIVHQLLDTLGGLALGGKKRTLTILMSDLRGFTAISERMSAQDLLTMLNHYLGEMTEIIQAGGGTIIEFIGDGIMALFGAPAPSETHAPDATACAIEMQARMVAINHWNAACGYPALEMGIGINTGEVIVGNIGSEKRTKYGVVGQQVNLCGRIESYTVGGQILISPRTCEMIHVPLDVTQQIEVFPKGIKTPLLVSQVVGMGAPYCVTCALAAETPTPLDLPVPVAFYAIHDKHCAEQAAQGEFISLSLSGAILSTVDPLSPFLNLKIETPAGEAFAKVLRGTETPGHWLLRFTSLPPVLSERAADAAAWRCAPRKDGKK